MRRRRQMMARMFGAAGSRHQGAQQPGKHMHYHEKLKREQIVQLLEELTTGIRNGSISLSQGGEELTLHPGKKMDIRICTRQTQQAEAMTVKLRWRRTTADGSPRLTISSAEPQADQADSETESETED